jgi:hypothetical protein
VGAVLVRVLRGGWVGAVRVRAVVGLGWGARASASRGGPTAPSRHTHVA